MSEMGSKSGSAPMSGLPESRHGSAVYEYTRQYRLKMIQSL
jgi:hypothetical protein